MLILILSNSLAVLSSFFLARMLCAKFSFTDFLLSCFTLFLGQIVCVGLCLGPMGRLFTPNIILTEFIILLVSLSAYAINNESGNKKEFPIEGQWALANPELFKRVFSNSAVHIYEVNH
jgi:hypothetical protein